MQEAKSCKTPVNPRLKQTGEESTLVDQELYQSAGGKVLSLEPGQTLLLL